MWLHLEPGSIKSWLSSNMVLRVSSNPVWLAVSQRVETRTQTCENREKTTQRHGEKTTVYTADRKTSEEPTLPAPASQTSSLQACGKAVFCCLSPSVSGTVWRQPPANTHISLSCRGQGDLREDKGTETGLNDGWDLWMGLGIPGKGQETIFESNGTADIWPFMACKDGNFIWFNQTGAKGLGRECGCLSRWRVATQCGRALGSPSPRSGWGQVPSQTLGFLFYKTRAKSYMCLPGSLGALK